MTNKGEFSEDQIGYCETIQDLKDSPTTSEIIAFASKKCGSIVDTKGDSIGENTNSSIEEIYTKFISNKPITPDEQQLILGFLNDQKALKMTQNIFSKLKIRQGDDNKFLFDIYLKNIKGDFDITNFVEYLKYYIENYSLITRSDISDITHIREINGANYYSYKCNGTNSVFIVTEGKIVYLDKKLFKIQILDNGLIFGTQLNLQEQEGEEAKEGIILEFDGKDFVQIYNKPGLELLTKIDIPIKGYDDLYKSEKHGKKGLIEFSKVNEGKENTQVKEIFASENEDIICNSSGFITTQNIEQILDGEEDIENIYRHTTYAKTDTYQGPPELPTMPVGQRETLDETSLLNLKNKYKGPLSLKPIMPICEILSSDKEFELNYLGNDYFMTVMEDGSNIYKFNETNLSFAEIEGLRRIQTREFRGHKKVLISEKELLDGKPTEINYSNGNCQIAIFNKDTQTITSLILIKADIYNTDIEKDRIKIKSGGKTLIYYYKDGKLYGFKKCFKFTKFNFFKEKGFNGFFQKSILLRDTYEEMQEYLEEIKGPVVID